MTILQTLFSANTIIAIFVTTIVVKVVQLMQGDDVKVKSRWSVLIVAVVITFLNTAFTGESLTDWQQIVNNIIVTVSSAVVFNLYLGQYTIDKLVDYAKSLIDKKIEKAKVDEGEPK